MIKLLNNVKKYVLELDESTSTYWCIREVGLTQNLEIIMYHKSKINTIPERLDGALVGFHSKISDKEKIFEKIEKLRIPYIISKRI